MPKLNVAIGNVSPLVLESLQSLRTSLMYMNDVKTIGITSTKPGEGKSVLSFYLAYTFASLGEKTLFIDCDMRKSRIKRYFKFKSENRLNGVSEYISGINDDIVYKTNISCLDIIPAGNCPPDPTGLLSSDYFKDLIKKYRNLYDYIIIDTPPVTVAADASIVGRVSDGIVYVVRENYIKSNQAKQCIESLRRNDCKVLGVVNNMVTRSREEYYHYYGNY